MLVISNSEQLKTFLTDLRVKNPSIKIGFVPTMGALHLGHLSLLEEAKKQSDFVIVSIFVNPTQFNDPKDLEKYPRTPEKDQDLLSQGGCNVLFLPSVEDIYPNNEENYNIDLGVLDEVMEGKFRPNHFIGVASVVEKFFKLIKPDLAFFGQKDFQQLAVIRKMVKLRELPVKVIACPTLRSTSGLALSSRNELLSDEDREKALIIFDTLQFGKEETRRETSIAQLKTEMTSYFNKGELQLEYLEIVNNDDFSIPDKVHPGITCCIAAYCGSVRLIDNMTLL